VHPAVRRNQTLVVVGVAVAAAGLVLHSLLWNFVTDDAFISFVYSRNLAKHGQLVFNLGERVEGYTNFLWTVLLAGLYKVGLQPEIMSRLLGTACGVATLGVCTWASRTLRGADWSPWDALPALLLAGVPGFACWSSGGLETALFTLLVTLGAVLYLVRDQPSRGSAIAFGLAALTRPEGILFFGLTGLHLVIVKLARKKWKPTGAELGWVAWFLVLVVPHLVWRRSYYGYWVPNTFYIKASGGAGTWNQGGYYLLQMILQFHLWMVPLLMVVGLLARREKGPLRLYGYVLLVAGAFFVYVASVGGDFMGLFRFALPIVPLLVLSASLGLWLLSDRLRPAVMVPLVIALLAGHAWHAFTVDKKSLTIGADRGIDTPGFLRWYTADRAAIGKWFAQYVKEDDYAAVGGAGAQVYYSGIRSLDCYGLSDAYIAHKVPAHSSRPGHQKYAPDDYILSKKPTIITSYNYRIGAAPYVGADEAMWRARGYHYVSVQIPGLSSPWYSFLLRNDRSLGPLPAEHGREP
jgi:arabinofuranosyltransferase